MPENRIIIIADDLTGANDTAIQFVKHGMKALVVTDEAFPESSVLADYDVLSFNSDSREMNPKDAYKKVRSLLQQLVAAKIEGLFYKKLDSVLRGNPGAELAAVMDELDIDLALVSPSFPANRSVLEDGILKSGKNGQAEINAVKIFSDGMEKKVDNIPLKIIRQGREEAAEFIHARYKDGVRVFIADALRDEDMLAVSDLSSVIGKPLIFAGAAALANQIARKMNSGQTKKNTAFSRNSYAPILVVAGTRQGETAAQVATLCETLSVPIIRFKVDLVEKGKSEEAVALSFDEAARYMEGKPSLCIVAVESMFNAAITEGSVAWNQSGNADSAAISSALGILTGKLTQAFHFPVMVTTGGDTTLQICKHLKISGIQPLAEIKPGIPFGKIIGGNCEGRYIVTKSGRFGNKETLVDIFKHISGEEL